MAGAILCLTFHTLSAEEHDDSSAVSLDEIVVKAFPKRVRLKNDGFEIRIAGTDIANAGTALDVLARMPFVAKTGSEIEVIGKGTPAVYINGRKVRDFAELSQLASSEVKTVEVVTAPGARYEASVNAVIRITTVAPVGEGISFSDRTTVGYKHYVYLFQQANLNFRKNGFDLFGMLNYENYRERPRSETDKTQYLQSGTVTQNSADRDLVEYPVYEGKLGLNYNSGEQYAGLYYDFSYRPASGHGSSCTSRLLDGALEDELKYSGTNRRHNRQHLLSAYYAGISGIWQLTANFDAIWQRNCRMTHETESSSVNADRIFSTDNEVTNRLLAGNLTASHPIWKGTLRFGAEASDILRRDLYHSDSELIAANDTKICETTSALFVEISQTLGCLSLSAGVRWEYTDSRYYLFGEKIDDQSRKYYNVAPAASLSLPLGRVSTNLSYTRKTTRPAFEQLSSAIRYLDRYSYESGNPNLRPICRDYLSLSTSWSDIVVELSYCSTKNYFMWQTSPYPGHPDATLLRMENMPRYGTYEAIANYSPCFFTVWRPTLMAGIMAQDLKLIHRESELRLDKPLGVFRFNNALRLPGDTWLNVDFSARTSGNGDNFYMKSRWSCDVGLYKSFANDSWSLKLQLNDVFGSQRFKMISYDALSTMKVDKINDTRDLSLTLRCDFNAARSRYRGRGAANTEKSRL